MSGATRGVSPGGRYDCYYCALDHKRTSANITVHDKRGCLHVCGEHAEFRVGTSMIEGHSADCPHRGA